MVHFWKVLIALTVSIRGLWSSSISSYGNSSPSKGLPGCMLTISLAKGSFSKFFLDFPHHSVWKIISKDPELDPLPGPSFPSTFSASFRLTTSLEHLEFFQEGSEKWRGSNSMLLSSTAWQQTWHTLMVKRGSQDYLWFSLCAQRQTEFLQMRNRWWNLRGVRTDKTHTSTHTL